MFWLVVTMTHSCMLSLLSPFPSFKNPRVPEVPTRPFPTLPQYDSRDFVPSNLKQVLRVVWDPILVCS